jgi:hypothetical protein
MADETVSKSRISPTKITSGLPAWPTAGRRRNCGVQPQLPLVHDGLFIFVDELDGVLDRQDMRLPRGVDVIDDGGQGGGLAGPRGAADQNEAALIFRHFLNHGGSPKLWNVGNDDGITRSAKFTNPRWV